MTDYDKYREIIKDYIAKNPDKEVYMAAGWIQNEEYKTKAYLDEIYSDKDNRQNAVHVRAQASDSFCAGLSCSQHFSHANVGHRKKGGFASGNAAFLFVMLRFFAPQWETNDDLLMSKFVDGQLSHKTAYVPFGTSFEKGKKYDVKINIGKNSLYSAPNTTIIP